MESTVINWLNSVIPGLGIFLAVVVLSTGFTVGLFKSIKQWVSKHDTKIKKREANRVADEKFKEQMIGLVEDVKRVNESIKKMDEEQKIHNEIVDENLEKFSQAIQKEGVDSRRGDHSLSLRMEAYERQNEKICKKLDNMTDSMNLIIDSDKEGIKSFITTEYYKAIEKGHVEIFTLESLESRYATYLRENGDTFVEGLMNELRSMKKSPITK